MYIFSFKYFDDFEFSFLKIIKKIKTKNIHVVNESCCKYENISMKNDLYFRRIKKDKFSKILGSFNCNHWMNNVRHIRDPGTAWLAVGQSLTESCSGGVPIV
jgi:hypothetical protein